jgi:hypothetical protein
MFSQVLKYLCPLALLLFLLVPLWDAAFPWASAGEILRLHTGERPILTRISINNGVDSREYWFLGSRGVSPQVIDVSKTPGGVIGVEQRALSPADVAFLVGEMLFSTAVIWWFWLRPGSKPTSRLSE